MPRVDATTPIGLATLADHSFLINVRGVATVVPSATGHVVGVLWSVTAEHIDALDGFEGLAKGNYVRERVAVELLGQTIDAWVYIACHDSPSTPRPGYLERVIDGAQHFGIDEEYVDSQLRVWATRPQESTGTS